MNDMTKTAQDIDLTAAPVPAYMARLKSQIRHAEAKADERLIATLDVMRSILHARQVEEMPAPHIGQEAVVRLGRAVQSDISAQNDLFRTHNALVDAKTLITGAPGHDDTLAYMGASEEVRQVAA